MPELPDVEIYRDYCRENALGKKVSRTSVLDEKMLQDVGAAKLERTLKKKAFTDTERRGKYLFLQVDGKKQYVLMHFGMSGDVQYRDETGERKYDRVLFEFEDGTVFSFRSRRRLGKIGLTDSVENAVKQLELGPDALDLKKSEFKEIVSHATGMIKPTLMDQSKIAGIGNIYSDEILFRARIHPKRKCRELDDREIGKLYSAMETVLRTAIDKEANPDRMPKSFLLSHRDSDRKCPSSCGGSIEKISVGGRSGRYCPKCQR